MSFVYSAALSIVALMIGLALYIGGATVYAVTLMSALAVAFICGCALVLHTSIFVAFLQAVLFVIALQATYLISGLLNELRTGRHAALSKCLRSRLGASHLDDDS